MFYRIFSGCFLFSFVCSFACKNGASEAGYPDLPRPVAGSVESQPVPGRIGEIPADSGWIRVSSGNSETAEWFRERKLLPDRMVRLYNGEPKANQNAQFAVLDVPIGKKDLMQCADAAMWLHAAALRDHGRVAEIRFLSTSGEWIGYSSWLNGTRWHVGEHLKPYQVAGGNDTDENFRNYMDFVYTYCGTYSLATQLKTIKDWSEVQIGDIFIEAGFPGHCVTVVDMEENSAGEKRMMLLQGYMPAQQLHILKNPGFRDETAWYKIPQKGNLITPEWRFGAKAILGRW